MLRTSKSTYKMLLSGRKWWLRTRMIGYDHALALQAALLLDDGPRIRKLLPPLLRAHYSRQGPNPWLIAEGAVIHEDESMWHKLGMGGNLIHLGETLKVVRLMAGIDDLSRGRLKVMPRIPSAWKGVSVKEYPISAWCAGGPATIAYEYKLNRNGAKLALELSQCIKTDVRLGPFKNPHCTGTLNGKEFPVEIVSTPAGCWVWMRGIKDRHIEIDITCRKSI